MGTFGTCLDRVVGGRAHLLGSSSPASSGVVLVGFLSGLIPMAAKTLVVGSPSGRSSSDSSSLTGFLPLKRFGAALGEVWGMVWVGVVVGRDFVRRLRWSAMVMSWASVF